MANADSTDLTDPYLKRDLRHLRNLCWLLISEIPESALAPVVFFVPFVSGREVATCWSLETLGESSLALLDGRRTSARCCQSRLLLLVRRLSYITAFARGARQCRALRLSRCRARTLLRRLPPQDPPSLRGRWPSPRHTRLRWRSQLLRALPRRAPNRVRGSRAASPPAIREWPPQRARDIGSHRRYSRPARARTRLAVPQ